MIPILFYSEASSFNTNGIGRLTDCISCTVTEERNGIYECEFEYPITGIRYSEIKEGRLIVCTHDDKRDLQPFRIYRRSAPIDGVVTFNAHHISYDLGNVILEPFTANSVADALSGMTTHSMNENRFTFWTNKATAANFKVTYPISVKAILGGMEGSILDVFGGGEYEFDKLSVKLYQTRGTDSGVTIRYGKNMTDITHEVDVGSTYNTVVPYWRDEASGACVYGDIVGGPIYITDVATWTEENRANMTDENGTVFEFDYGRVVTVPLDLSSEYGEGVVPTKAQLNTKASQKLQNGTAYLPKENIEVDFVQLWQTDEYANVAVLQRVSLCDTVSVYYTALGLKAEKQKVIKVVYNTLLDRYDSMEIGAAKTSFADTITGKIEETIIPQTVDMMQAAIDHATELLTGGAGGHVIFETDADGKPQEIYIMDTEDANTAVNVLRINLNGIGFSNHGINGPYGTAWTLDGHFVADYITTGTLNANLLRAGVIRSISGTSYWDLTSGDLVTASEHMDFTAGTYDAFYYLFIEGLRYAATECIRYSYTSRNTGKMLNSRTWTWANAAFEDLITTIEKNVNRMVLFVLTKDDLNEFSPGEYLEDSDFAMLNESVKWDSDLGGICYSLGVLGTGHDLKLALKPDLVDIYSNRGRLIIGSGAGGYSAVGVFAGDGANVDASSGYLYASSGHVYAKTGIIEANGTSFIIGHRTNTNYQLKNSGTTLYWGSSVVQMASTSSRRYKKYIKDISDKSLDPHRLLDLPVRQFKYLAATNLQYKDTKEVLIPGFIAEEVDEVYPAATIHHPETGEIESWDERRIIPGMLALIQEQQKAIEALTARIEKLEAITNADTRPTD